MLFSENDERILEVSYTYIVIRFCSSEQRLPYYAIYLDVFRVPILRHVPVLQDISLVQHPLHPREPLLPPGFVVRGTG